MAMDSATTLAAATGISRGRNISLAAPLAFLLGALWPGSFLFVFKSAERCLAVESSLWGDDECRVSIQLTSTVAALSLTIMLAFRLGGRCGLGRQHGGAQDGRPDLELDSAAVAFYLVNLPLAVIIIAAPMTHLAGSRWLREDPAHERAASLVKYAPIYYNAANVAFYVQLCFLVTPFVLVMLMRFLRENCVASQMA